jgi:hypothetical protein
VCHWPSHFPANDVCICNWTITSQKEHWAICIYVLLFLTVYVRDSGIMSLRNIKNEIIRVRFGSCDS